MLNGAGIAGGWRCCLCLSVWALEQGSLQTHLTPIRVFMGCGSHSFVAGVRMPLWLHGPAGSSSGEGPEGSTAGPICCSTAGGWHPLHGASAGHHLTSLQHGMCLPRPVIACEGAQSSYPPQKASDTGVSGLALTQLGHFPPQWQWPLQKQHLTAAPVWFKPGSPS